MIDKDNGIFIGTACFLVKDNYISSDCEFIKFLHSEDFSIWNRHGFYDSVSWIYININSKIYAPGMPGISICETVGNHAITIEEFKCIYAIYKKYEGLLPLQFGE